MDLDRFSRVRLLFKDNFEKLSDVKVLILGCGGVGGVVIDSLYRSGITKLSVVDCDKFDITNQNRQIGSEHVGMFKAKFFEQNYEGIRGIVSKIDKNWLDSVDFFEFDFVVDAIDDIVAKVEIVKKNHPNLITSLGSAKRIDPSYIKADNFKNIVSSDKFFKKFKTYLQKSKIETDFLVVYSTEPPLCKEMGSSICVTASFGLRISSIIIQKILNKNFKCDDRR